MCARSDDQVVSPALREHLLQLAIPAFRPKGTILFRRGQTCAGVFLIRKGKVRLTLDTVTAMFPPRLLGAGCVVGLPAALAGSPYSLTAEIVEDSDLALVSQRDLCDCLRENAELCFEVMNILSNEISSTRFAMKQRPPRPRAN